ncbi:MAG: Rpn family recombination-promoting nuclease/putative transposase [Lachnospiraceae bacterium]|nr:Rpn family recombination-promoting nuclease/putative transposase [Lachnospiraceae bacterium]
MKKDVTANSVRSTGAREETGVIPYIKPYEELEFRDDFMFGKVMQDKELCREVLECLLQHPVGELDDPVPQREFRYTSEGKPIRLDIYTRDEDAVYDAEIQNLNKKSIKSLELPKRSRFYQASIDMDHMNRGGNYKTLPDSIVLFICTFDPFKKGLFKYTVRGICEEDHDIVINDGAVRIFYNCCYRGNDIPVELKQFYDYVETGKSNNELTRKLDGAVERARKVEEWRSAYMIESIRLMDARDEGREEERKNTEAAIKRAEEAEQRARNEGKRADDESRRADEESRRADDESRRAEAAEQRADTAEHRADAAEHRADAAEFIIAKYKAKYGEL